MPELKSAWEGMWKVHLDLSDFEAQEREARRRYAPGDPTLEDIERELSSKRRAASVQGKGILEQLERYPDRHYGIEKYLSAFHVDGVFDRSVFIMTKYPDGAEEMDRALVKVIDSVKAAVSGCGMTPRLASERRYHDRLWTNVQIYMLGCSRGIAIMEGKYRAELNPNVAMEWGWMTALGRNVLYLREETFAHARADWDGLLHDTFDWENPEPGVAAAVTRFLKGQ